MNVLMNNILAVTAGFTIRFASDEKNKRILIELLDQKVKDPNTSGSPLKLIGYTFPKGFPMRYKFKSSVEFDRAHFLGEVDFTGCVFEKDVSFYETEFNGEANFSNATFNGEASFLATNFNGEVKANFSSATFNGKAEFHETIFNVECDFSDTVFNGEFSFYEASFNGEVKANFSSARFNGRASFYETSFEKDVYFYSATFNGEATFNEIKFNGEASFSQSKFNSSLSFTDNTPNGTISFNHVLFREKDQIVFNGDLSKVSFANTDITRIRFGDRVVWGKNETRSGRAETDQPDDITTSNRERFDFKIHDERLIEENLAGYPPNSLESVIAEYRNLRENYEYYLRYEEAGKFFMREMELRRNYNQPLSTSTEEIRKRNIVARNLGLIGLYHLVCDYGESIRKPLIIIICAFIFATIFFSYQNGWSMENFDPVRKALASFFPFFSLNNDPSLPEMILKATMLPMVGLLFITLRRKLERRFRH
jgi:hypothetical protein